MAEDSDSEEEESEEDSEKPSRPVVESPLEEMPPMSEPLPVPTKHLRRQEKRRLSRLIGAMAAGSVWNRGVYFQGAVAEIDETVHLLHSSTTEGEQGAEAKAGREEVRTDTKEGRMAISEEVSILKPLLTILKPTEAVLKAWESIQSGPPEDPKRCT